LPFCSENLHSAMTGTKNGTGLLADAFLAARARDPRLHLVCAGGGPDEAALRARLDDAVTMLGWLDGEELAAVYASADVLLLCSQTDTFGQVVLEAQASGLSVVAVAAGGPAELVADGRSGLLCPPSAQALAGAMTGLAGSRVMRERLARGGLAAVRERSWEAALARLGEGWRIALAAADRRAAVAPDTHPASAGAPVCAAPDTHPAAAGAAAAPDTYPAAADDPTEVMAA
jgi:glycosyltransferase involved in cell wall biosynthesis